jgi:hypothetical protein
LGFVDIHLLAACVLASESLFTADKPLAAAAKKLHLLYSQAYLLIQIVLL